jgi:hypothetical protein
MWTKERIFIMGSDASAFIKSFESINDNISEGYENIPRGLLQSCDKIKDGIKHKHDTFGFLSLKAIGLLCNLKSYPAKWRLRKTELYKRFEKDGRTSVSSAFDELVENGYIIQFKIRDGKKYDYVFYFNIVPFTEDQIKLIEEKENATIARSIKTKQSKRSKKPDNTNDSSGVDFQQPKKSSWDVDFVQPKMGSPKSTPNILNSQENTHEDITQKDLKDLDDDELKKDKVVDLMRNDMRLEKTYKLCLKYKVGFKDCINVIDKLAAVEFEYDFMMIDQQLKYMQEKLGNEEPINDFSQYFIGGLKIKSEQAHFKPRKREEKQLSKEDLDAFKKLSGNLLNSEDGINGRI